MNQTTPPPLKTTKVKLKKLKSSELKKRTIYNVFGVKVKDLRAGDKTEHGTFMGEVEPDGHRRFREDDGASTWISFRSPSCIVLVYQKIS